MQKKDSSADAVMLGRLFLNDERNQLREDRRLVAEDPGLYADWFISVELCLALS